MRNSKINDQRPHGTWPFTSIFKRMPTKHPTDPSLVLVCDLCANAAEDGQLGRRTVSTASFVPKPPQLQDLNIGERAMIRKMSGINLDSMTAAASQLKEGMIFPDLYPLGCGFWVKGDGPLSRSFEEDMEIKLNSVDPRWRTDQEWPTWAAAVAGGKVELTELIARAEMKRGLAAKSFTSDPIPPPEPAANTLEVAAHGTTRVRQTVFDTQLIRRSYHDVIAVVPQSPNSLKGTDVLIPSYSSCYPITNPVVLSPGATAAVVGIGRICRK
ncbi:hypothetical protein C8J57DRAFT_1584002 [Mycena rebaudengoi]|nr:hypothetical protein C8J57DRAFT_1584002 [Mycena rebaudengoi]